MFNILITALNFYNMKIHTPKHLQFAVFFFIFMTGGDAHAYLDPGTGSIIIQGLIGVVAAASVTIGLYWQKIKLFFIRKNVEKNSDSEDSEI